ncbi:MAG: KamA family radical SAM protein [Planctomycetota bacterium]
MPELERLPEDVRTDMRAVSAVLPFRVNNYVVEELIRWENGPEDPIYQLTFPQPEMLEPESLDKLRALIRRDAPAAEVTAVARRIQAQLNPHPAGQRELNVPRLDGKPLPGVQHKYRETVLFFPSQGQTCHAYCTYCFRWAQFVGIDELKFANREASSLVSYLEEHPEVQSVLFTGGDPLIMRTRILRRYIEPLLAPELEHINSIRLGTKATTYWPFRFLTDNDSDDLLRLFEEVRKAGKHLAIMAHVTHPRELETPAAQEAMRRILATGAVVRCQAPIVKHVNDRASTWADMWRLQVRLGAVPYYMFIARDTGPKNYFEVPLSRAYEVFRRAYRRVSGLARTVRGPSMSATPGKVLVNGTAEIRGEKVFVLQLEQARNPSWVRIPFFARYDPDATWLDQLEPAFGEKEFFFASEMRRIEAGNVTPAWGLKQVRRRPISVFGHVEWE